MATIRDIAHKLGLSPSTVSLALHGSTKVHPSTREQVREMAQSLGYVRNLAAASLSSGRSWRVELVCNLEFIGGGFLADFLRGAYGVLHPAGYSLTLSALTEPGEAVEHLDRLRAAGAVDAVLFTNPTVHDPFRDPLLPAVVLGRPPGPSRVPRVDSDNPRVGGDIARLLARLGHRQVRVLAPVERTFASDRYQGMLDAWRDLGLDEVGLECVPVEGDAATVRAALDDFGGTAVVTMSDSDAAHALRALRAKGLNVPEDVSLVGMNDDLAPLMEPTLTSVDLNAPALGAAAARAILDALSGREVPSLTLVEHVLNVRSSTTEARPRHLRGLQAGRGPAEGDRP